MSELKKINGPVNVVGEIEATSLDINGNADISGNTVAGGKITLDQDQITTNISTTSAIILAPGATTDETGKSSIFLGTSASAANYGISLRGARLSTDAVPTFEIGTHTNSANGFSTFKLDASTLTLRTNMGTAGNFSGAQVRIDTLNTPSNTGFQGIRFATSTSANYGWSMGANRRTDGRGSLRFYEHAGSDAGTERFTLLEDGNVGVGTNAPETMLHLFKAAAAPVLLTLHNSQSDINPNNSQGNFIDFKMTDTNPTFTPQVRIGMLVNDTDGDGGMPSEGAGNFVVYTGQGTDTSGNGTLSEGMRVTDKGSVGIGAVAPASKLHVAGTVQVGVNDTGHDVVFYGATSGKKMQWDESADTLIVDGVLDVNGNADVSGTLDVAGDITLGNRFNLGDNGVMTWGNTNNYGQLSWDGVYALISGQTGKGIKFRTNGSGTALILDTSQNATFAGTIGSGAITSTGKVTGTELEGTSLDINGNADISGNITSAGWTGDVIASAYLDADTMHLGVAQAITANKIFNDSVQAKFGTDGDLQIFHNGTGIINNDTGNLLIKNSTNDGDIIFQSDNGSGGLATYLTLDGSDANIKVAQHMILADGKGAYFGTGSDLSIYHNATNSYILNATGDLEIINGANDKDIIFKCDDGSGGVETYLIMDGSASAGNPVMYMLDGGVMGFGNAADLNISHDGTNSLITNSKGNLVITNSANDKDILFQSDNGSGGLATYFYLDGSVGYTITQKHIRFNDNVKAYFGTGSDLSMDFDGTNGQILQAAGDLYITNSANDKDVIFQSDDGAGGVATYFSLDGSAAIHDGSATTALYTQFPDKSRISLGSGNDTFMTHSGTNFTMSNTTGHMYFTQGTDDGDMVFLCDNGSGGTTGYLTLDGGLGYTTAHKHIRFNDSVQARFGTGSDLQIQHDGSNSYISNHSGGHLYIQQNLDDQDIVLQCDDGSGGTTAYVTVDGGVGRTYFHKHLNMVDDAKVMVGTGSDLQIYHDGSNSFVKQLTGNLTFEQNSDDGDIIFKSDDGAGGVATYFLLDGSAATHDGSVTTALHTVFPDKSYINLGTGSDFQMHHNGVDTILGNQTGDLKIRQFANDKDILFVCDDGSGGVATYLTLDGSDANMKVAKDMVFADSVDASFGTGEDLKIYHDGSNTYMQNATGTLHIDQMVDDGDLALRCDNGSGGHTAYLTLDGGLGYTTAQKHIRFNDSVQALFGTGADLKMYHNATNSFITNLTGDLTIDSQGDDLILKSADDVDILVQGSEVAAKFAGNGSVSLYHNNVQKFETTTAGATIVGTLLTSHIQTPDTSGSSFELFDSDGDTCLNISSKVSSGDMTVEIGDTGEAGNGAKLVVDDGNAKVSIVNAELNVAGVITGKQKQVFNNNFTDDLSTIKHYIPFQMVYEQTSPYSEIVASLMPCDGRIVSVTVRVTILSGSGNMTMGIHTVPPGTTSFSTGNWTEEETEVLAVASTDDYHAFHFAFSNAKHFDSGDLLALSIQNSADLSTNAIWYVTTVVEYDWNTFLGGTSAEFDSNP